MELTLDQQKKVSVANPKDLKESLLNVESDVARRHFREIVSSKGTFQLRQTFLKLSQSSEGFYHLRTNFMKSHGGNCMIGYLLGIGDRHNKNILISLRNGKSINIDFGYAFGSSFLLPIPEISPFRFTPQIQGLMYPFKTQGLFKETMVQVLQKLRQHQDIVMAALSLFVKEPSLDWIKETSLLRGVNVQQLAKTRLAVVKDKFDCKDPSKILEQELKTTYESRREAGFPTYQLTAARLSTSAKQDWP